MSARQITRRHLLRLAGVGLAGLAAAACAPKVVEVTKVVEKVVKETVVEEKVVKETVVQVQEKVVKETVVVEKQQPTAAPAKFDLVHWAEGHLTSTEATWQPYVDALLNRYKELYPNVTVKLENHGWDNDLRQNLVTALLAGTGPDIICGENYFQEYGDLGALVPLDEYVQDIKDNMVFATYAAGVTKGKIYGVNQMTGLFGFARNSKVLEKAGLDPKTSPKTWDEFLEVCDKVVKAGKGNYHGYAMMGTKGWIVAGIFQLAVWMKQAGADLCKDDCTYPFYDNPKTEEVWTFLRKLQAMTPPGMTFNPDQGVVYGAVWKDLVAYAMDGSWSLTAVRKPENAHITFAPFPIPKGGKDASIVVANVLNAVMTASKHKAEAAAFCKIFQEDAVQDMLYPVFGWLPSTKSALKKLRETGTDSDKVYIDIFLNGDPGILPQWRREAQKLWTILNDLLEKVLATNEPIKGLMQKAQQDADAVLKPA